MNNIFKKIFSITKKNKIPEKSRTENSSANIISEANFYELKSKYCEEFAEIFTKARPYTMISETGAFLNYQMVNYIENNHIEGDIVECGVWKGGSCMIMALTLMKRGNTSRKIYMYDTYEGMTEPTNADVNAYNDYAIDLFKEQNQTQNFTLGEKGWCEADIEEVKLNMSKTGYPINKIHFIKGKVEDTIPNIIPEKIALLRLDTDWYKSTKHEMNYLYPIVTYNAPVILDDYCYWAGSRKAIDEYFSNEKERKPLLIQIGSVDNGGLGLLLKIKP